MLVRAADRLKIGGGQEYSGPAQYMNKRIFYSHSPLIQGKWRDEEVMGTETGWNTKGWVRERHHMEQPV